MTARGRPARRGYVILIGLIMGITLIGMKVQHWSFEKTEAFSLGGVMICLIFAEIRRGR